MAIVRLVGFRHADASPDGVYEPGERVRVHGLRVQNTGGMPTPSKDELRLALVPTPWLEPLSRARAASRPARA